MPPVPGRLEIVSLGQPFGVYVDYAHTDDALKNVLTTLREISLYHTQVTDEGLAHLRGLANLHDLTLSGSHITNKGLMQLTALRTLKRLTLSVYLNSLLDRDSNGCGKASRSSLV